MPETLDATFTIVKFQANNTLRTVWVDSSDEGFKGQVVVSPYNHLHNPQTKSYADCSALSGVRQLDVKHLVLWL